MIEAYERLHELGHAHSVESWQNGQLAGGVYGVAIGGFFGFTHYSGPTPALGYYEGAEMQWRDLFAHWDLSLDARIFDHVQRDKLLASDPQNGDPVEWYTMQAPTLFLSRRF